MIRVLVAEDLRILRDTLVSVLNLEDDIKGGRPGGRTRMDAVRIATEAGWL